MVPASMTRQHGSTAAGSYIRPFARQMTAAMLALPAHRPMKKDPMK